MHLMSLKPLEVLRKGFNVLQGQFRAQKEKLQTQLAERKPISSEDEKWLDHEANLVDEEQVLEILEKASDYERGLGRLDSVQKTTSPAHSLICPDVLTFLLKNSSIYFW